MTDGSPKIDNQQSLRTITDEQIVTERKSPRRLFLTGAALLVGSAVALVSGCGQDPDKAKSKTPPAQAKPQEPAEDPDKAKTK